MILASLLAFAGADAAMAPSGKWTVDYGADQCVVSRKFGSESAAFLAFQPFASMGVTGMQMLVLVPNSGGNGNEIGKATISLLPSGISKTLNYTSWVSQPSGLRHYKMFVDADDLVPIAQSTGMTIDIDKKSLMLATGKIQSALDAATKCNDDLMRSWGVDPAAKATPVGNPGEWFTDDDYPPIALKRHVQGHVKIALTVGPDGTIKGCRIVATSGDPDLDRGTCDVARAHARYVQKSGGDRFDILAVGWAFGNR